MDSVVGLCSDKPRASNANATRTRGWWSRDVWHIAADKSFKATLCGRDANGWLNLGFIETPAGIDLHCCKVCARRGGFQRPSDTKQDSGTGAK